MYFAFSIVVQVTALAIVGFFLLFAAGKTQGVVAFIGRALAVWVYFIAAVVLAAAVMAYFHMGPYWTAAVNRYVPNRHYRMPQNPPVQRQVPSKPSGPRTQLPRTY